MKSIAKLKKEAWTEFSKYVRLKECLLTTGTKDYGKCFTCDNVYSFKSLQAGHMVGGRSIGILFEEDMVRAQCYRCNVGLKGNYVEFRERMCNLYGESRVRELEQLRHETGSWDRDYLVKLKEEYKNLYKEMYENN